MRGTWGLFSPNQPLDTSASEVKPSWQSSPHTAPLPAGCSSVTRFSCSLPKRIPQKRHKVNLFSQQRALEVGEKKITNLPIGKTTRHCHNWGVCEHFRYLRASGAGRVDQVWVGSPPGHGSQAGRLHQAHPQVPRVSACPPPSLRTSDIRAIWIIRLQPTSPCEIPAALGLLRGSTQSLAPQVAHTPWAATILLSTAALSGENSSKQWMWLRVPCLPSQSVTRSQNHYNASSNFCIKWPKPLNIAVAFFHTKGSECRNAAFLWHSLEISIVSQESTPELIKCFAPPPKNSPPFHEENLDQGSFFNDSISPRLFFKYFQGSGCGEKATHRLSPYFLPQQVGRQFCKPGCAYFKSEDPARTGMQWLLGLRISPWITSQAHSMSSRFSSTLWQS